MFALEIEKVESLGRRRFWVIIQKPRPSVRRYLWRGEVPHGTPGA